jgi:hypothetical protein
VTEWVVLLHVAVAFWFVAGLLGRNRSSWLMVTKPF